MTQRATDHASGASMTGSNAERRRLAKKLQAISQPDNIAPLHRRNSATFDLSKPARIFFWLLCRTFGDRGNWQSATMPRRTTTAWMSRPSKKQAVIAPGHIPDAPANDAASPSRLASRIGRWSGFWAATTPASRDARGVEARNTGECRGSRRDRPGRVGPCADGITRSSIGLPDSRSDDRHEDTKRLAGPGACRGHKP